MSAEENKALVRRWFAAIDAHDLDAIDELLAEDYVDHSPALAEQEFVRPTGRSWRHPPTRSTASRNRRPWATGC
jgi:ketosteroid isomerase-like protein